jgi:Ca-activated chloride channel family protein
VKRLRRAFVPVVFFSCLILLLFGFNIAVVAQQTPNQTEQIAIPRPDADSIVMPVTVMDKKGNPIDGLDKNAFAISDNKFPQEITFFESRDEPVSIGIIFDLSGSMTGSKKLRAARAAVLHFMELSHSDNDYFVIAFASRPLVLIDWTHDSKTAAGKLSRYYFTSKNANTTSSNTALYDACYLGVEKMASSATHSRQAILLITDGQDNNSQYTFANVRERLKETGVTFYSVIIVDDDLGSSLGMGAQAEFDELSAISGGKAYFPGTVEEINVLFDRIAMELRHQYLLGFNPSKDKADGKWHRIKIKVIPPPIATGHAPTVYVRNREGYYSRKNLR